MSGNFVLEFAKRGTDFDSGVIEFTLQGIQKVSFSNAPLFGKKLFYPSL